MARLAFSYEDINRLHGALIDAEAKARRWPADWMADVGTGRAEQKMNTPTSTDIASIAALIVPMITAGTPEEALLAAVARRFPELTSAELSAALQEATAAAERQATRDIRTD